MTVTSDAIAVAYYSSPAAKNAVEERGLPDVRTSDYADYR